MSLLRSAAWLFFAQGAVYFLIGAATPFALHLGTALFFSPRSDTGYFGGDPQDLQERDPNLTKLRTLLVLSIAGLLVGLGLAVMALAWFALRSGHAWGYWSLVAVGAFMVPYWALVIGKYVAAGADIGVGDVPPFMWFTTLLWVAGVVTGAVGLRS